jgi:hypothetical protein
VSAAGERYTCSHVGCLARLPGSYRGTEIPPGWTVARIEEHTVTTVNLYYIYLCPRHKLTSTERQTSLPFVSGATS